MSTRNRLLQFFIAAISLTAQLWAPAAVAQAPAAKPNILFIMGDDIGFMQPSIYHRGLACGRNAQHRSHWSEKVRSS